MTKQCKLHRCKAIQNTTQFNAMTHAKQRQMQKSNTFATARHYNDKYKAMQLQMHINAMWNVKQYNEWWTRANWRTNEKQCNYKHNVLQ